MRMLLVGFQPQHGITYPHLQQVWLHLSANGGDYCLFRERGYFLGERPGFRNLLRSLARSAQTAATVCADVLRLVWRRGRGRYDVVVATDNFSFMVAARLFPRVVLWSHDFLTDDEPRSASIVQRLIKRGVRSGLRRHGALIIQDQDRLGLFCETYLGSRQPEGLAAFLLPVSLLPLDPQPVATTPRSPPVLMQIGGINVSRSHSDLLLRDFELQHHCYDLAFHGFFDNVMLRQLATTQLPPWSSNIPLAADDVHRIVRKCDIGFIAYNAGNLNFYFVAHASGQLAEFLRCGKPVISLGRSSLGELLEERMLGRRIDDIGELAGAVAQISANYPEYTSNCRRAFAETYDLGRHLPPLLKWLRDVSGSTR